MKKNLTSESFSAIAFGGPLLILSGILVLYPALANIPYSLTRWNGFQQAQWVGLQNYLRMFEDPRFRAALRNAGIMAAWIPLGIVLPLLLADGLRTQVPGWKSFRAVLYMPVVLGQPILAIIMRQIFVAHGALNQILEAAGLGTVSWIGTSANAIQTTSFLFVVWNRMGFGVVYLFAAMSTVEGSLYEAATIDGAGWFRKFVSVTVPSIRSAIEFWAALLAIEVFARTFAFVFAFTSGGPGYATNTLEYGIYVYGFKFFQSGYASAWASFLFLVSLVIGLIQARLYTRGAKDRA